MTKNVKIIMLKCPRVTCRHKWDYTGKNNWVASCPRCKTTVSVKQARSPPTERNDNETRARTGGDA